MKPFSLLLSLAFLAMSCQDSSKKSAEAPGVESDSSPGVETPSLDRKEQAKALLQAAAAIDTAKVRTLLAEDYIQHNPFIPTGREGFIALLPILEANGTYAETQRIFVDGDYVVMHNLWKNAMPFGAAEMASFDILRIEDDGTIAEHWDALMPIAPKNPSGRSLLDGATQVVDRDRTEAHKAKVTELFDRLINGDPSTMGEVLPLYFAEEYHQHNPDAADGIAGFAAAIQEGRLSFEIKEQHAVFGEGNFVLSVSEGVHNGVPAVFYDLLRFEGGKIVEHWDVIQNIPSENLANSNTMFGF